MKMRFLGAMLSDDVHGRREEDELVLGIQIDFSCRGVGVGVLVQWKIPDQKVASRRGVVPSEDLPSEDGHSSDGQRLVAQDLREKVGFLPGDESGGLWRNLIGTGGECEYEKKDCDLGHYFKSEQGDSSMGRVRFQIHRLKTEKILSIIQQ